jgi:hypothetical protein
LISTLPPVGGDVEGATLPSALTYGL